MLLIPASDWQRLFPLHQFGSDVQKRTLKSRADFSMLHLETVNACIFTTYIESCSLVRSVKYPEHNWDIYTEVFCLKVSINKE
jgi:hypothetical protein